MLALSTTALGESGSLLGKFWAIAKNSFAEITRQPVYGILLLVGAAMIAFSPIITAFTMMEDIKLLIDMGLGTIFMFGIVLAVLSATQIIGREIEAKTAGTVISKPVGRFVFVTAKFVGLSLAMALATYLFTVILLMTVRVGVPSEARYRMDMPAFWAELLPFVLAMGLALYANYFYRWNFTSTAVVLAVPLYTLSLIGLCLVDRNWRFDSGEHFWIANTFLQKHCDQIFLAALLVTLGVWVIASVATAASTRLNVVPNVLICSAVFFVGMVSRYLFVQTGNFSWAGLLPAWVAPYADGIWLGVRSVAYRLVPSFQTFWVADQLIRPEPYIPLHYVGTAALYAVGWCAGMVAFAAFLFEKRDII